MAPIDPHWLEYRRKYFIRPNGNVKPRANAHLSIRHDAYRFMPPGSPCYVGKDVVRYFWPDPICDQPPHFDDVVDPAQQAAERAELLAIKSDLAELIAIRRERAELQAIKRELAKVRFEIKFRRLMRDFKAGFNPGQPRDETGKWSGGGTNPRASVQQAFLQTAPAAAKALEALLALYALWSSRNRPDSQTVFAFRADMFVPGAAAIDPATRVASLTKEEVDEACPRHAEVQSITNHAAESTDRGSYRSDAAYGTAVHKKIEREINGPTTVPRSPPRDSNFRAEVSSIKSNEENYGVPGTRRIDVLENPGKGTVCVYDVKTGWRPLTFSRMQELADTVSFFYPGTQRIIVTEVRPGR
jgi:hypothetical protein